MAILSQQTDTSPIARNAQDIANSQGVAYKELATQQETKPASTFQGFDAGNVQNQINTTATVKPVSSYVDNARNTVAGQLNTLLSSSSPYIRQAEQKAKEQSADRGLLNSTIAASAGRTAAINAALPIAQQDAETYTKFGLQQQAAENTQATTKAEAISSGALEQQKAAIAERQQAVQNAFNARLSSANEQSKTLLQGMADAHAVVMSDLELSSNQIIQQYALDADKANSIRTAASGIVQNYQVSVENLLTDPDFLDLDAAAMNNAINQLQSLARNSIKFVGASSGVDLTGFVDYYLTNIQVA